MEIVKIKLTKGQQEIVKPLMQRAHAASAVGEPGGVLLQIHNDLKTAEGCFLPNKYAQIVKQATDWFKREVGG